MTGYIGRSKARLIRAQQRVRNGWGRGEAAAAAEEPAEVPSVPEPIAAAAVACEPIPEPAPAPEVLAASAPSALLSRRFFIGASLAAGSAGLAATMIPSAQRAPEVREKAAPALFDTPRDYAASPEVGLPRPEWEARANGPVLTRKVSLLNENTGERIRAIYWADGDYELEELEQVYHLLRDHHADEMRAIDPKLVDMLYLLGQRLETEEPFHILSAYRTRKTNAKLARRYDGVAYNSFHMKGMAVDLHMPGRRKRDLLRAAHSLDRGGVGNYRTYVHLDSGPTRRW